MKNRKDIQLMAVLLMLAIPSVRAAVVSVDEARSVAQQYVQNARKTQGFRGVTMQGNTDFSEPFTLLTRDGEAALYVFNRAGGGYVIVSAESDTQREVLGWSDGGTYDPAHVPAPLKAVLDSYADGIRHLTADEDEDTVYDLFGRRVTNLQPGTLYLKNGRKFLAR